MTYFCSIVFAVDIEVCSRSSIAAAVEFMGSDCSRIIVTPRGLRQPLIHAELFEWAE